MALYKLNKMRPTQFYYANNYRLTNVYQSVTIITAKVRIYSDFGS